MKIATFEHQGRELVGEVDVAQGRVYLLPADEMVDLIARFDAIRAAYVRSGAGIALDDVRLRAPLPRPRRNLFCVGKNYREHAREFSRSGYEAGALADSELDAFPAVFTKPGSCVVGPGDMVDLHGAVSSAVDYEGELAVVIGRGGRNIAPADAMQHVVGYTIVNDVTARDRQKNHRQWFLGKSLDTFCPMGPWIVSADELDARSVRIRTSVNGEARQDATTADLLFDIPSLIATISAGMMLQPGDVIATGTPAGVGIGMSPPRFLAAGDVVAITIDGIGALSNPFGALAP